MKTPPYHCWVPTHTPIASWWEAGSICCFQNRWWNEFGLYFLYISDVLVHIISRSPWCISSYPLFYLMTMRSAAFILLLDSSESAHFPPLWKQHNDSEIRISGLAFLPEIQKLFFNQLWRCSLCLFLLGGQNVMCVVNGHSEHNYSIVLISGEDLILATCTFWNSAIVTNPPICHDELVNQQSNTLSKPPVNGEWMCM